MDISKFFLLIVKIFSTIVLNTLHNYCSGFYQWLNVSQVQVHYENWNISVWVTQKLLFVDSTVAEHHYFGSTPICIVHSCCTTDWVIWFRRENMPNMQMHVRCCWFCCSWSPVQWQSIDALIGNQWFAAGGASISHSLSVSAAEHCPSHTKRDI